MHTVELDRIGGAQGYRRVAARFDSRCQEPAGAAHMPGAEVDVIDTGLEVLHDVVARAAA